MTVETGIGNIPQDAAATAQQEKETQLESELLKMPFFSRPQDGFGQYEIEPHDYLAIELGKQSAESVQSAMHRRYAEDHYRITPDQFLRFLKTTRNLNTKEQSIPENLVQKLQALGDPARQEAYVRGYADFNSHKMLRFFADEHGERKDQLEGLPPHAADILAGMLDRTMEDESVLSPGMENILHIAKAYASLGVFDAVRDLAQEKDTDSSVMKEKRQALRRFLEDVDREK